MSFSDALFRVQDSCLVPGSSLPAWIVCCCCATCCSRGDLFVCLFVLFFLSKATENETNREVRIVCCCCSTCCLRRQPGHTMCQVVPGDSRAHNTMLLMSWKAARGRGDRGKTWDPPGEHTIPYPYPHHTIQ